MFAIEPKTLSLALSQRERELVVALPFDNK
jgi:hypothetical protein